MTAFFSGLLQLIEMVAKWMLDGAMYLLQYFLYCIVDGFLTVITMLFMALNLANMLGVYVCNWSGLPSQMGYVIGQCGIPACIAVLLGAISLRVAINIIPSWATRI